MAWIVTFNSFKGGAGRSTTCLNVAYQLAQRGKKVLLVDLDLHGPGLGTLLDCDDAVGDRGIVSYLSAPGLEPIGQHLIRISLKGAEFDFMGAPVAEEKSASLPSETGPIEKRMEQLAAQAEEQYDFVLIDAASGLSDYAVLAFTISHSVALCFRWSRQHLAGSIRTLAILCEILDSGSFPLKDFTLVANAVPAPVNIRQQRIVDAVYAAIDGKLKQRWSNEMLPSRRPLPEPQRIPEKEEMKFWEEVVTDDDRDASGYAHLADYILQRSELA